MQISSPAPLPEAAIAGDGPFELIVLAATVLTALFTGWAIWQRWRYTPRPLFTEPEPFVAARDILVSFRVRNNGDGIAHDVRIQIRGEDEPWQDQPADGLAMVAPAEYVRFSVPILVTGGAQRASGTGVVFEPREVEWKPYYVRVSYRQHPNLKRIRAETFALPDPTGRLG